MLYTRRYLVKRAALILLILAMLFVSGGNQVFSRGTQIAYDQTNNQTIKIDVKETIPASPRPIITPEAEEEAIKTTPAPQPTRITIAAAGDLMCLYAQLCSARKKGGYKFDYCFDEIKDKISGADLAICNFETLVAKGYSYTGRSPAHGNPKINAPESFLSAAVNCGFDVYINANNHIYDRKADGINKTINKLNEFGVMHTGAYAKGETRTQLIADVKGIKLAILSYTDHINGIRKTAMADKYSEKLVTADISAVKEAGADYIIVYMHWGKENTHKVNKTQKKMAAFVANAGADIIIGSHPHCTQGAQIIKTEHGDVPVFYSLGNLISSMCRTINKDSLILNIVLEKNNETGITAIAALTYTPTLCTNTSAGRFVILPADLESIAQSSRAKTLKSSRARTVKVLSDKAATPE